MNRNNTIVALALTGLLAGVAGAATSWNEIPLTENTFAQGSGEYRQGSYEIPVPAYTGLEYKVAMEEGQVIVYEWGSDIGDPALLATEFHGHTEPVGGEGDLMFYRIHNDGKGSGMLRAPFSGMHGWYLNNESEQDVTVTLRVAGFYTEVDGQL